MKNMPLFWLSLCFLTGIGFGSLFSLPPLGWIAASLALIPLLWLPRLKLWLIVNRSDWIRVVVSGLDVRQLRRILKPVNFMRASLPSKIALPGLGIAFFMGALRLSLTVFSISEQDLAFYNDQNQPVALEGVVIAYPDERDLYTALVVQVDHIRPAEESWVAVQGKALIRLEPGGEWRYGDRLRLFGELITPSEDETFSYKEYLSQRSIHSLMIRAQAEKIAQGQGNRIFAALYALRGFSQHTINAMYPDPEAALLNGILLGLERGIPTDLVQAFQVTGTAHIVAISGFNMSILSGLCVILLDRWLGRKRGALFTVVVIALYTLLVGAQASVIRAAIMGGLSVFAAQVGRRQNGLNSLAFVAAVMAAVHPFVLWDVGFQLSVAATLGLVLFGDAWLLGFEQFLTPHLGRAISRRVAKPVGDYFLLTLAAQVMTLPVIVYHFGRLSLVSLIANPFILPLQPAIMIGGGISLLAGFLCLPIGKVFAWGVLPLITLTIRVVEECSLLPGAELISTRGDLLFVIAFYGGILAMILLHSKVKGKISQLRPAFGLAALAVLSIQVWRAAWTAPDGKLHLIILDVSHGTISGEAILIQTPQGRYVLVNGGPSSSQLSSALGRRLAGNGNGLDFLVIAGNKNGQIQALPAVVKRFTPREVIWAGEMNASRFGRYLYEALLAENRLPQPAIEGMDLDLGQGARMTFLKVQSHGAVLLVEWRSFRVLLPLGVDFETLATLRQMPDLAPLTAISLAHSGLSSLNPPGWIISTQPAMVLLSVSALDSSGLPDEELLRSLEKYTVLRTDVHGWIELITDGKQMWVEVEKAFQDYDVR